VTSPLDADRGLSPLLPPGAVAAALERLVEPIAVTGSTGFVGSHLIETLVAGGLKPRALVRRRDALGWLDGLPLNLVEGSLADDGALRELLAGAATVFHLAGVVRAGRQQDFDLGNRAGTAKLVRVMAAAAPGASLVHVSSLAAAGPSATIGGRRPEDPPAPISAYGRSKLAGEEEVRSLADAARWVILRPPAIYGPRDIDILHFFKMAQWGVMAVPRGDRFLTIAHVGDVVRAILAAASAPPHRCYHLGNPEPFRIRDLAAEIAAAGHCRPRIIGIPGPLVGAAGLVGSLLQGLGFRRIAMTRDKAQEMLARHWTADTRDSLQALGIGEPTPLGAGAAATWTWYREQGWL
jgi:nucleoside-diphosphate-sugar epimerase